MSKMMDDVIATIGRTDYEIDSEHTLGPVSFTELEYDNVSLDEQVSSDEHYLFAGDELVAICVCFDKKVMTFDDALAHLTERFGEAEDVDLAVLGNGIYAVDDEGKLEGRALAVVYGDVMIVITEDEDEIEVTYVDPTAGFILAA